MPLEIFNCEQGSDEWFRCRMGIPTASEFATVMAKGKDGGHSQTRKTYMYKLAGERISGTPMESFSNSYMERGKLLETAARELYAFMTDADPELVGFVRNGNTGCSPDALIGDDGLLEIKTKAPHIMIDCILKGDIPPEHIAQMQGALWITGRQWCDLFCYYRGDNGMGKPMFFKRRMKRIEEYIRKLEDSVHQFNRELESLVQDIKNCMDCQ